MRLNLTQAIMVAGFGCVCISTLYAGHVIKTELTLVYKQIDSQPKRIAEEIKLPLGAPIPVDRPALNELPPDLILRMIRKD
jgi:hypothetical protein